MTHIGRHERLMWARARDILSRYLIASVWVYFTLLGLWTLGNLVTGDRYIPVALITVLGPYLFLPLVLVLPLGLLTWRKDLLGGAAAALVVFILLWGARFLPKSAPDAPGPSLTVMTYNVLGSHDEVESALATLRAVDADLVFMQELTPGMGEALAAELRDQYPYQILQPEGGVTGMGIISRYPLVPTGESLPLNWVGEPQIVELSLGDEQVTLIHFHSWAFRLATFEVLEHNFRLREAQAFVLANYAREAMGEGPVIAAGDLNAVDRSDAYRRVTQVLGDAWLEGGVGLGHTFPGSSRPRLFGVRIPRWIARIDYVFLSDHWQVDGAWLAPFDGVSDHRGVVAELVRSP